ncbi:hypothetical protein LBMAG29_09470 [Methylophilaceae bacterium]|nr:hypothetical protein LBMAG29_09470 [Methylophilaceae bacterium]
MNVKLKKLVVTQLKIDESQYSENLKLGDVPTWDSMGHINLMFSIEEAYGIQLDSDEITNAKSIGLINQILQKRISK